MTQDNNQTLDDAICPDSYKNVIDYTINSHKNDKGNAQFVKLAPTASDGKTKYTGEFELSYDLKFVEGLGNAAGAESIQAYYGYFIQNVIKDGTSYKTTNAFTITDEVRTFNIGVTYRFTMKVNITEDQKQYFQFNLRNVAQTGFKYVLSNCLYLVSLSLHS